MTNDPRNASARARSASNPDNQNIDWSSVSRYPVLYEQKVQGITVDVRQPAIQVVDHRIVSSMPTFQPSRNHPSRIYRWDRISGIKRLIAELPARPLESVWPKAA